jgi:hypothetical protein
MFTKCPYCKKNITSVEIKWIDINENMQPVWKWISYVCPHLDCNTLLSVSIDPIAIKTDIIEWLLEKLRK